MRQPDWDIDLRAGEASERLVVDLLTDDTLEVKHDHRAKATGQLYVETECLTRNGWMPSGICTTKASVWFFVLDEEEKVMVSISTVTLKDHVERFRARNPLCMNVGSHPTKGVGVPLAAVTKDLVRS